MAMPDYPFFEQYRRRKQKENSLASAAEGTSRGSKAWTKEEDQHIIDATLRGEGYAKISATLSNETRVRSQQDCINRVRKLSNTRVSGGVLPRTWSWSIVQMKKRRQRMRVENIPFTDDERVELFMWRFNHGQGLNPLVFQDERCAEEIRKELARITKDVDPETLTVAARYWTKKREDEWRQLAQRTV